MRVLRFLLAVAAGVYVVAAIAALAGAVLAVIGAIVLVRLCWVGVCIVYGMVLERRERRAALIERAAQQHAWVMQGDPRGVYGEPR